MAGRQANRAGPASKKGPPTMEEFTHDLKDVMISLMNNQKAAYNSSESFTDVVLILQDGIIPVHGVLLEAVSEFFRKCFESQGPYYYGPREVFLPDFKMKTMLKVIQLLYNPTAFVQTESEAKEVVEAIKFLGIELDGGLSYTKVINAHCPEDMQSFTVTNFKSRDYLGRPMIQTEGKTVVTSDGKKVELEGLSVTAPRLTSASSSSSTPTTPSSPPKPAAVPAAVPNLAPPQAPVMIPPIPSSSYKPHEIAEPDSSGEDSSTASEMDDPPRIDISRAVRYILKAKICQKCKTKYDTAAEANACLNSHDCHRCWVCFRVYKSTDLLNEHYVRAHRKGAEEKFGVCGICIKSIPLESLPSHVIATHLTCSK